MAKQTQTAAATSTSRKASAVPKGMKLIEGGYAKTWNVEEMPVLEGKVREPVKTVTLTQGTAKDPETGQRRPKTVDRDCIEVQTDDGDRYTVWESAGLKALFSALSEGKFPAKVWIAFKGYGTAKKGQNAPKLFDSAIG